MIFAPRDGRWIEARLDQGSAYAYWTGAYWDDGAGYIVDAIGWRPGEPSPVDARAHAVNEAPRHD